MAATDFSSLFTRLRSILQRHAGELTVADDTASSYCLEANPGPATLAARKSKLKRAKIPVAWVQIGKTYVSYHLMGLGSGKKLLDGTSMKLRARMQGKTCFNFRTEDEKLFEELETLTADSLLAIRQAEIIAG
jgi:hypothetical protein